MYDIICWNYDIIIPNLWYHIHDTVTKNCIFVLLLQYMIFNVYDIICWNHGFETMISYIWSRLWYQIVYDIICQVVNTTTMISYVDTYESHSWEMYMKIYDIKIWYTVSHYDIIVLTYNIMCWPMISYINDIIHNICIWYSIWCYM